MATVNPTDCTKFGTWKLTVEASPKSPVSYIVIRLCVQSFGNFNMGADPSIMHFAKELQQFLLNFND